MKYTERMEQNHEKGQEISIIKNFGISQRSITIQNCSAPSHVLVIPYICFEIFYPCSSTVGII